MIDKIWLTGMSFWLFLWWYIECSGYSSYLEELKFNKYIVIRNKILAKILISKNPDRNIWIDPCNYNKMTVVGLRAYIITFPFSLMQIIVLPMWAFTHKGGNNTSPLITIIIIIAIANAIIIGIMRIINLMSYKKKHKD